VHEPMGGSPAPISDIFTASSFKRRRGANGKEGQRRGIDGVEKCRLSKLSAKAGQRKGSTQRGEDLVSVVVCPPRRNRRGRKHYQ